ncbi:MAG: hypothetical protein GY829_05555, partial [Gammaproteobacteria bacterium]|nr:hypothetical protein [Gammaproteobacteria bacterium]
MTRTYSQRWKTILEKLRDGLLVVTASNRQADFLRQQYRYFQLAEGSENHTVWRRPSIITNKQWLKSLYQQFIIHHGDKESPWSLISEQESRILWEQVIEDDGDYLLDTRRTAERVRQAANRLEQWNLTDTVSKDDSFNWREETRRFKQWHQLVSKQCQTNFWIEFYQLDQWISERIELIGENNNSALLPENIGLVGFQQISPAKEQFFHRLEQQNTNFLKLEPNPIEAEIYRIELSDSREEIKQTALWAKEHWLANPEQRLGIVLPNLNNYRELTRITFERIFCPSEIITSDDQVQRPFDISLGLPLSSYPLIDNAVMLIKLLSEPLTQDESVQFLLSPYLTTIEQQTLLAMMISLIRKSRQAHFTIDDLSYFSSQADTDNEEAEKQGVISELLQQLKTFNVSEKLAPSQWAIKVGELLEQVSWCDKRKLSSSEYQTKEAWNKKIDQMAIYDQLSGKVRWSTFRRLLYRIIRETLFQPQTGDCPIQIMGVLEAASLTFDKIRICGIDNRLWPDSAKPSPFIPYELQRQYDMPNATAERELAVSQQLFQSLSNSSKEVIFSHSKNNGDELLSVSPLIESLELREFKNHSDIQSPAKLLNQIGKEIESIEDNMAPEIQDYVVKGGSKLLQDIARCQFRAFAHHRLHANAADAPREDLDPLDRGNLVHRILEQCWLQLFDKQQTNLQELHQAKQLEDAIEPLIKEALNNLQQERHTPLTEAIINIENKRLNKLLLQWFEMEVTRPHFTVKDLEQTINAPIAGNYIRLQLDRVDELADGSLAIIDYKTGKVERKNWFGERPDEPQLPLYAMVLSEQKKTIGALLYGQVKISENRFIGVADDKSLVSGVNKNFYKEKLNTEAETLAEQV